jgi:F-type H+-transporting ATPase subunit alpha
MPKKSLHSLAGLDKHIKHVSLKPEVYSQGQIISLADGIAQVSGLGDIMLNEMVSFPHQLTGLAFNLEEDKIGVVVLGDEKKLKEGDLVQSTDQILALPVSRDCLGRMINPLGEPLDGKTSIQSQACGPLEKIAPGVIQRKTVNTPLQTGIKAVDAMIPIGRGQRELIIGDRGTGKTTLAVDTILNQADQNVICIYVAVGQKANRIARIYEQLQRAHALEYTTVMAANASDPVSLQYLAPFSGCALAEFFMALGKDVLIVYDDLSKHAWAYRQLSLLLKRPSGREAYPGDIFYLHSRLLERACRLDDKYGGGSITALPIVETQAGDISSYIPTNVISITDGQIYLESDLFFAGVRPAINVGLSVSRVGGNAQIKAMKKVASKLRLDLAQYRELAAFTQFTTDLDPETKKKIEVGSRIAEIFKQPQNSPMPVAEQVVIIWAVTQGFLDEIPVTLVKTFEKNFLAAVKLEAAKILREIGRKGELGEEQIKTLTKIITSFTKDFKKEFQLEEAHVSVNQTDQKQD